MESTNLIQPSHSRTKSKGVMHKRTRPKFNLHTARDSIDHGNDALSSLNLLNIKTEEQSEPILLSDHFELKEFSVINFGSFGRCSLHTARDERFKYRNYDDNGNEIDNTKLKVGIKFSYSKIGNYGLENISIYPKILNCCCARIPKCEKIIKSAKKVQHMREPKMSFAPNKEEIKAHSQIRKTVRNKVSANSVQISLERPKQIRRNNSVLFPQKQALYTTKFNGINIKIDSRQKSLKDDAEKEQYERRPMTKASSIENFESTCNPIRTPKYTKESTINDVESNNPELPQGIKHSPVVKRRVKTLYSVNNEERKEQITEQTNPTMKIEDYRPIGILQRPVEIAKLNNKIIKPLQSLKYKPMKIKKIIRTTSVRLLDRFKKSKVYDLTHPKPSDIILKL